jgi:hypothetical protein
MLTVSNHRPYTYPEGPPVEHGPPRLPPDARKAARENAAGYAAWAFAQFIEQARQRPWFADTVFILVGDHGPRAIGAAQVPVEAFRVPLLFYAPHRIAPHRYDVVGSSLDLIPTLLGFLGLSYDSPFFGVDLRRVPTDGGRIAIAHNYAVAHGSRGLISVLGPARRITGYRLPRHGLAGQTHRAHLIPLDTPDPATTQTAIAVTQFAHRLFYAGEYHETGATH